MKTSAKGLELIKAFEGLRLTAYRCPAGVWTIGYGHTSAAGDPGVRPSMTITEAQADEILRRDLVKFEGAVIGALKRPPTQHQFDAMVSLAFNVGVTAFARSTVVQRFNAGDMIGASGAFAMWRKANGKVLPGLVARRAAEQKLFNTPDREPISVPPPPVPPKPDAEHLEQSWFTRLLRILGVIS